MKKKKKTTKHFPDKEKKEIDKIFYEINKDLKSLLKGNKNQKKQKEKKLQSDLNYLFNKEGRIDVLPVNLSKFGVKKTSKKPSKNKIANKNQSGGFNFSYSGIIGSMIAMVLREFSDNEVKDFTDCDERFVDCGEGKSNPEEAFRTHAQLIKDNTTIMEKTRSRSKYIGSFMKIFMFCNLAVMLSGIGSGTESPSGDGTGNPSDDGTGTSSDGGTGGTS